MELQRKETDASAVRRRKTQRRKITTILAIVVLIVAIAFVVKGRSAKKSPISGLVTGTVEQTTIEQKISATGSITAQTGASIKIGSQVTGRIKRLYADVGSQVKAGQVIAELDLPDVRAQLDQAIANLNSARVKLAEQQSGVGLQRTTTSTDIDKAAASLESARASYNQAVSSAKLDVGTAEASVRQARANAVNAQTYVKRERQLLAKGYIAAQDVDNAQTQADVYVAQLDSAEQNLQLVKSKSATDVATARSAVDTARAALAAARAGGAQDIIKLHQVNEARAAVAQAQAQVQYYQAQFDKTIIRTPISGTVITLDAQQGETVAAGLSAPTLIQVVDLKRLQVDAYVDETDIGNVHIGQPVSVTVDAYPDRKFHGHVVKIASGATTQENVVTYDTTIAIDDAGGLLKPDMTATAEIVVGEHRNVMAVPIEAVKTEKKGPFVYVVKGDTVVPQYVETGVSDDTMTEIKSGLKVGDTIVLAGMDTGNEHGPRMGLFGPGGGSKGSGRRSGGRGPGEP